MSEIKKFVRVNPVNLRGEIEGYTFSCQNFDCDGKDGGQPLPDNCELVESASRVSSRGEREILRTLVSAQCKVLPWDS